MTLHDLTTAQLQAQVENLKARANLPMPWEDPKELHYQAGIRQEILTVRGVQ
jgi:hypothetical protein